MAHVEKYKASALGHMLAHYNRTSPANKDIDASRTAQNYNLAPERGDLLNFIKTRLANGVKIQKRSDVNMLCDWVITLPKDLPAEKERDFFINSYEFLVNKYGEKNVVSAYVHKDESTPHMHFAFLPVVQEKKNKKRLGQEKLSAKECITRTDLQKFHQQLQDYLEQKLNCKVNILNAATKNGNRSIADLKKQSQSTESLLTWLKNAEKHVERTKMGMGGVLGEEAVKMPVKVFRELTTLAEYTVDVSVDIKSLRQKRDSNAKARAEADELKKELAKIQLQLAETKLRLEDQIKFTAYVQDKAKEQAKYEYNIGYKQGYADYQSEHRREIKNSKLLEMAIEYADIKADIDDLLSLAQDRQQQERERAKEKKNTRYTGR